MGILSNLAAFFSNPGVLFSFGLVALVIVVGLVMRSFKLNGKLTLVLVVAFFGVVTTINVYMAYSAVHSFPGLEVENGYVASQSFDEERKAQLALGWDVKASLEPGSVRVDILGPDGGPANASSIKAMIGRTTERDFDQELTFATTSTGSLVAPITPLGIGKWELRLSAVAGDGTPFRQRIVLIVPES